VATPVRPTHQIAAPVAIPPSKVTLSATDRVSLTMPKAAKMPRNAKIVIGLVIIKAKAVTKALASPP